MGPEIETEYSDWIFVGFQENNRIESQELYYDTLCGPEKSGA